MEKKGDLYMTRPLTWKDGDDVIKLFFIVIAIISDVMTDYGDDYKEQSVVS